MQLTIPSILGYEVIVRDAVASLTQQFGLAPERIEDIKTALCEACTNAIEHGNHADPQRKVRVICTIDEQYLIVEVCDEGTDPPVLPQKPIEWTISPSTSFRGRGLMLMTALADEVNVVPDALTGTCVRLIFYRHPTNVVVDVS
ncbi:ATP-binding protein [Chloroflexus sp.]|uniref:ATP-binding protein n=1 Tax=Chloroflexus sp. TaxID=1904827 RepID=UPI002ADD5092|nr:ATP-binding protein [Chloroflexus sp.]